MYTVEARAQLLERLSAYLRGDDLFEGLAQIGSGADGFRDIYSDIDLMAGCRDAAAAGERLHTFFRESGAVYIDRRQWDSDVLGFSAYWANGLSVDISFMPTAKIPVLSDRIRIVFSKSAAFEERIRTGLDAYQPPKADASTHHAFFFALRRCEIALLRGEYLYADMALGEARVMLLRFVSDGGDPKRFNDLEASFLTALEKTYPAARSREAISRAKEAMLRLYLDCGGLPPDDPQWKLIGCFDG